MNKYFFISALISITICGYSLAQEEHNHLGGSFGGSDFHIKDDHASPLIFSSIGIAPTLQYIHKGDEGRHYAEISYYYDYLWTSSDNFHNDNHRGRIRYSYLHSISEFKVINKDFELFLGGSIASFLCHSDYYHSWIPPSVSRTIESWYWSNSLDLSAQLEYNATPREYFSIQFFIPIVSNISRPKYSSSGDYNYVDNDWKFKMFGETKFFPENFSMDFLFTYQRPVIWKFNLQLSYEFYYSFYNEPQNVNMYINNLRAGLFFCF